MFYFLYDSNCIHTFIIPISVMYNNLICLLFIVYVIISCLLYQVFLWFIVFVILAFCNEYKCLAKLSFISYMSHIVVIVCKYTNITDIISVTFPLLQFHLFKFQRNQCCKHSVDGSLCGNTVKQGLYPNNHVLCLVWFQKRAEF